MNIKNLRLISPIIHLERYNYYRIVDVSTIKKLTEYTYVFSKVLYLPKDTTLANVLSFNSLRSSIHTFLFNKRIEYPLGYVEDHYQIDASVSQIQPLSTKDYLTFVNILKKLYFNKITIENFGNIKYKYQNH